MNDRELLELAARAAGYQFSYSYHPLSIPTVKKQHIPGLEAAYKVARNASDRDFIGFLITVAKRDLQKTQPGATSSP
ncbi:hypothetical protein ACV33P_15470 [Pseudomonas aeruginosa]